MASNTLRKIPAPSTRDLDLFIFDLDGTLIDTRQDLANAVNFALQKLGKPTLPLDQVTRLVGDGVHTLLARILAEDSQDQRAAALAHFRAYYAEHLADHSRLYPHIPELLARLHAKKKAVLSNKPHEFTLALLRRLGVEVQFDAIRGGRETAPLKPHPQILQEILTELHTPAARAVIIGDGENDILVGQAAGTLTCAVTYGFRAAEILSALRPDWLVHAPEKLLEVFS